MEVRLHDRPFLPEARILPAGMQAPKEQLETVQKTLELARIYEIDRKVSLSLDDLIVSRSRIQAFYHAVEDPHQELTATFFVDKQLQITEASGVILRARLQLVEYLVYCVFGMTGLLEQIGDKQYKLTSRDKCLHKRRVNAGNQKVDKVEMDELAMTVEREMEAKGISPVIILED
jgi:hypothetical protein